MPHPESDTGYNARDHGITMVTGIYVFRLYCTLFVPDILNKKQGKRITSMKKQLKSVVSCALAVMLAAAGCVQMYSVHAFASKKQYNIGSYPRLRLGAGSEAPQGYVAFALAKILTL